MGQLVQAVILDDARAGNVAGLRFGLAPFGGGLQTRQPFRGGLAQFQTLPGVFRMHLIGGGIGKGFHLLGQPGFAAHLGEFLTQDREQVAQMGHIGERIFLLLVRQRAARPVGETRALVEIHLHQRTHQIVVRHGIAQAHGHGGDLAVKQRFGDQPAALVKEDFQILPAGVKHLHDALIGQQVIEGLKVETFGQRVDQHFGVVARRLYQAQLRPERALAHKLGVYGDKLGFTQLRTRLGQGLSIGDPFHGPLEYTEESGLASPQLTEGFFVATACAR